MIQYSTPSKPIDPAPVHLSPYNLQGEAAKALYFKRVERLRASMLRRQQRRFLVALNRQTREAMRGGLDGILDRITEDGIRSVYEVVYVDVGVEFATRVYDDFAGKSLGVYFVSSRYEDAPLQVHLKANQGLIDDWVETIMRLVREGEVARLIQRVTEETKQTVRAIIADGITEGLSIEKLARKLDNDWGLFNRTRARRIARTETIRASNFGSVEGAKATGLALKKEWIITYDARTRESHRLMDRHEHVGLEAPFYVPDTKAGGTIDEQGRTEGPSFPAQFPGDATLPAGQSINCRCTVAYITTDLD